MSEFDHGPPARFAQLFDREPDPPDKRDFWFDWGPVFYRGRLDGSARVMCIASDPGPTERIAGRSLVGNAGQRVQGLLAKPARTATFFLALGSLNLNAPQMCDAPYTTVCIR